MSDSAPDPHDYQEVAESPDFRELQSRHRSFVFPLAVLSSIWYFVYVLLAAFAHDFMAHAGLRVDINVGLLFGLGQFVTTFAITMAYVSLREPQARPASADPQELRSRRLRMNDVAPRPTATSRTTPS